MPERRIYRVVFTSQGQVYELYARSVSQGALFGFVEVEGILFGKRSELVVDPNEESLKREFEGVKRFSVPMHAVVRIDEVEKQGVNRVAPRAKGDVTPFPTPVPGPPTSSTDPK